MVSKLMQNCSLLEVIPIAEPKVKALQNRSQKRLNAVRITRKGLVWKDPPNRFQLRLIP
jgi:hypothetical protein